MVTDSEDDRVTSNEGVTVSVCCILSEKVVERVVDGDTVSV